MLEILNLESLEPLARGRLDPMLYDYIAGGAADEWTLAENREAWSRLQLLPRMLRGVANRSLETTVLGNWDRRGLYGIDNIDPSFKEITIETRVGTNAPKETVAEVARRAHQGCPIYRTLGAAMSLTFKLFMNGEAVLL